jgi:eukaryotic-like serine/threonine-protein kinase
MATRPRPGDTAAPTELLAPPGPPLPPEEPPPDRELWPWLVVLLVLVLAGLAAAWYATRDSGSAKPRTVQTTVAAAPARPRPKKKPQTTTAVEQVVVPDIVGQKQDDAVGTLEAQGLSASVTEVPSTQEKGLVVAQAPRGGEKVDKGSSVAVNVSKGPNKPPEPTTVTVPNVVGEPVDSASAAVGAAGLHASVQHVPSTESEGTVVSQSPSGGSSAQKGAGVLLNVSSGPATAKPAKNEKQSGRQQPTAVSVPSVVGEDKETAKSDLKSAGFKVSTVDQPTSDPSQDRMVVDQSPPAGTSAPESSTVTIYVGRLDGG